MSGPSDFELDAAIFDDALHEIRFGYPLKTPQDDDPTLERWTDLGDELYDDEES